MTETNNEKESHISKKLSNSDRCYRDNKTRLHVEDYCWPPQTGWPLSFHVFMEDLLHARHSRTHILGNTKTLTDHPYSYVIFSLTEIKYMSGSHDHTAV